MVIPNRDLAMDAGLRARLLAADREALIETKALGMTRSGATTPSAPPPNAPRRCAGSGRWPAGAFR